MIQVLIVDNNKNNNLYTTKCKQTNKQTLTHSPFNITEGQKKQEAEC